MKLDITDPDDVLGLAFGIVVLAAAVAIVLCGVAGVCALAKYVYLWEPAP